MTSKTSEDVLLNVSNVRHKKSDGSLYVLKESIIFIPNGRDKFTFKAKYSEVKAQKISPDGKPKTQLQLTLHNGEAPTFHFVNPDGQPAQKADRDAVKELLQQLLPKFKPKVSNDMIEKKRILQTHRDLYQLYKDLVATQIISADEFWTKVAANKLAPSVSDEPASLSDIFKTAEQSDQPVGINPAFMSTVTFGINNTTLNLTNDIVEAILRTYPAVRKKHEENVPSKMTQAEFFLQFFKSHYFYRDRVFTGSSYKSDLFGDCDRQDDEAMKEAARLGVDDPFVDLTRFKDDHYVDAVTSATGIPADSLLPSSLSVQEKKSGKSKKRDSEDVPTSIITPNQALIKRFNHHSTMVLDTCLHSMNSQKDLTGETAKDDTDSDSKKRKIEEKLALEDLTEQEETLGDWTAIGCRPLKITEKDKYMNGPSEGSDLRQFANTSTFNETVEKQQEVLNSWTSNLPQCLTAPVALAALNDLRPGGSMMIIGTSTDLKVSITKEVQTELQNIYRAGNELLRHFASCFPVTSEKSEEKLREMKLTLEKFKIAKLEPFHEKLLRNHNPELTEHLNQQINAAFERFKRWQTKQNNRALKAKKAVVS